METKTRSFVKTAIYRLGSFSVIAGISYIVTGSIRDSAEISIGYQVLSAGVYFIYERIWSRVSWGRKSQKNLIHLK